MFYSFYTSCGCKMCILLFLHNVGTLVVWRCWLAVLRDCLMYTYNIDCCNELLGVRYIATTPLVDATCEFWCFLFHSVGTLVSILYFLIYLRLGSNWGRFFMDEWEAESTVVLVAGKEQQARNAIAIKGVNWLMLWNKGTSNAKSFQLKTGLLL